MVKKTKKENFQNSNLSDVTDKRKFWTTVSLLFGNKVETNHRINLIEKNVLVTSDEEIAITFKEFFAEIAPKLNIIQYECNIRKTRDI